MDLNAAADPKNDNVQVLLELNYAFKRNLPSDALETSGNQTKKLNATISEDCLTL